MAIDWGLFQAPNVAGNALAGFRQARSDRMDQAEFGMRQEDIEARRQQNALQTQRQIASEDQQTRDRHRERAAQLYIGLRRVPEAQRRQAAVAAVSQLGLPPDEAERVLATINDPATTWDDNSIDSRIRFLGGDPDAGAFTLGRSRFGPDGRLIATAPMDPTEQAYMEARTLAAQAQVPLRRAQAERARRPPAGRSGGGRRGGGAAPAGGAGGGWEPF